MGAGQSARGRRVLVGGSPMQPKHCKMMPGSGTPMHPEPHRGLQMRAADAGAARAGGAAHLIYLGVRRLVVLSLVLEEEGGCLGIGHRLVLLRGVWQCRALSWRGPPDMCRMNAGPRGGPAPGVVACPAGLHPLPAAGGSPQSPPPAIGPGWRRQTPASGRGPTAGRQMVAHEQSRWGLAQPPPPSLGPVQPICP